MKSKTPLKSRALFWLLTNVQSFTQFLESLSSQRLVEYIRQLIFAFDVGDVNLFLFLRLPHKEETHVNVPCSLMENNRIANEGDGALVVASLWAHLWWELGAWISRNGQSGTIAHVESLEYGLDVVWL